MKPENMITGESDQEKKVMEKGSCFDCAHYHDCPRMKGINRCYNMHFVQTDVSHGKNFDPGIKP
jgi:hypothetical protein